MFHRRKKYFINIPGRGKCVFIGSCTPTWARRCWWSVGGRLMRSIVHTLSWIVVVIAPSELVEVAPSGCIETGVSITERSGEECTRSDPDALGSRRGSCWWVGGDSEVRSSRTLLVLWLIRNSSSVSAFERHSLDKLIVLSVVIRVVFSKHKSDQ